jgi:phosphate transport system substrate-binding protein
MRARFTLVAGLVAMLMSGASVRADELSIVGTGDGMEMLTALASVFAADHAETRVLVPPSIGSGGAIAAVGADRAVLGRIARPLSEAERELALRALPIVRIPSAVFVHPSAGVSGLSAAQVADIYAGKVENWRELGGRDLKIKIVRRDDADSTLAVLRATMPGWRDLVLTTRSKVAVTTQEAVETVKRVEGAIGFGPYSTLLEPEAAVLRIDGQRPTDPGYPSAVTLALLYKDATVTPDARAFMAFARSQRARNVLATLGGVAAAVD